MSRVTHIVPIIAAAALGGCVGEREAPAEGRTAPAQNPAAVVNPAPIVPPTPPGPSELPELDEQGPPDDAMPPGPVNPLPEDPPSR